MDTTRRLALSLLLLRLSLALVLGAWAADKFVNPEHGAAVLQGFYGLADVPQNAVFALGAVQAALVAAFVLGLARIWSYGAVLLMHAVTTLVSWKAYLGLDNILFFSAWPMLAALIALFLLRDQDTILTLAGRGRRGRRATASWKNSTPPILTSAPTPRHGRTSQRSSSQPRNVCSRPPT